jgi:hypothetical protein
LSAFDAVPTETPAAAATSTIVTRDGTGNPLSVLLPDPANQRRGSP